MENAVGLLLFIKQQRQPDLGPTDNGKHYSVQYNETKYEKPVAEHHRRTHPSDEKDSLGMTDK